MIPDDYIALAVRLAAGTMEAEWRTAVSRAYYAAFHAARRLLLDLKFAAPRSDVAHAYLYHRLNNCGELSIRQAALDLNDLRQLRNRADYDWHIPFIRQQAQSPPATAQAVVQTLDAARQEPTRTQITDAMKLYERTVLRVVTWHP
jgi:uncharacterized protein (UPF0332 family)